MGSIVTVVLLLLPFMAAVIVTFSNIVARPEALVENLKPVAVAGMFTDAGTGKFAEVLVSVATRPPGGASAEIIAAQRSSALESVLPVYN